MSNHLNMLLIYPIMTDISIILNSYIGKKDLIDDVIMSIEISNGCAC